MTMNLSGRTIAITGASSGIGRATAFACANAGMNVIVAARREDELKSVVDSIRSTGGRAAYVVMDVSNPHDNARLIEAALDHFGSIYSVFANAGYGIERPVLTYTRPHPRLLQLRQQDRPPQLRRVLRHQGPAGPLCPRHARRARRQGRRGV